MSGVYVVWFNQDLRVHDHAALRAACLSAHRDGRTVLPLYIHSSADTADGSELSSFLLESLRDLQGALSIRDALLHFRAGDPLTILSDIHREHGIAGLFLHAPQDSDFRLELRNWCGRAGIALRELEQGVRDINHQGREAWLNLWEAYMASPRHEAPDQIDAANVGVGQFPLMPETGAIKGGRKIAVEILKAYLSKAGDLTKLAQTQPGLAEQAYQRLLPHMHVGALSVREVWQAAAIAKDRYARAGQDIRAASVRRFMQLLAKAQRPSLTKAAFQSPQSRGPKPGASPNKPKQLSLDLS